MSATVALAASPVALVFLRAITARLTARSPLSTKSRPSLADRIRGLERAIEAAFDLKNTLRDGRTRDLKRKIQAKKKRKELKEPQREALRKPTKRKGEKEPKRMSATGDWDDTS